uniref:Small ribosomal subunit protein uS17 n=1 Tax=Strongyloides stercoralis TaxID=6248 RepID=A0A0K0EDK0_STRER
MAEQNERAYQKQSAIFENPKTLFTKAESAIFKKRYTKDVGLGFKTPIEAVTGKYIDKKCPFTGNVSIRGRILTGVVSKKKMQKTVILRRDYLHYIPKYRRYEKRHTNLAAHCSPAFRDLQVGDTVTVGQCRPLSKTVRFNVLKVHSRGRAKKAFNKF